jgi:hypothetical protein
VCPRIHSITPYEDFTQRAINEPGGVQFNRDENGKADDAQMQIPEADPSHRDPYFCEEQVTEWNRNIWKKNGSAPGDTPFNSTRWLRQGSYRCSAKASLRCPLRRGLGHQE